MLGGADTLGSAEGPMVGGAADTLCPIEGSIDGPEIKCDRRKRWL